MSFVSAHIIQKLSFEVKKSTEKGSFSFQQSLGAWSKKSLLPAIEKLFDEYDDKELFFTINRLEIEVGKVNIDNWQEELLEQVLQDLKQELDAKIVPSKVQQRSEIAKKSVFAEDASIKGTVRKKDAIKRARQSEAQVGEEVVVKQFVQQHHFEQWIFFLERGFLPWNAPKLDAETWQKEVLAILKKEAFPAGQFQKQLQKSDRSLLRFIVQYDDAFLIAVMSQLSKLRPTQVLNLVEEIQQLIDKLSLQTSTTFSLKSKVETRTEIWKWFVQSEVFTNSTGTSLPNTLIRLFKIKPTELSSFLNTLNNLLFDYPQNYPTLLKRKPDLQKDIEKLLDTIEGLDKNTSKPLSKSKGEKLDSSFRKDADSAKEMPEHPSTQSAREISKSSATKEETSSAATKKAGYVKGIREDNKTEASKNKSYPESGIPKEQKADNQDSNTNQANLSTNQIVQEKSPFFKSNTPNITTEFYIENAGIILLHPFLSPLFDACHLLANKQFQSSTTQIKALYLIHYLTSGSTTAQEYELVLAKFLCGLPLNYPIPKDIQLKKEQLEEANHLLKTVVQHWSALGNTSPDGLREGFLQRAGKLAKRNDSWYLQIEPKTIDILLDRLPWGISMIQLPWKKELLLVEWNP
ncbi:MAG: contractile injection system tape measure protein [Bacteroidota bacterium]